MDSTRAAYGEVYVYTMGRPGFILQHVVDGFAVQTDKDKSRPIGVVFGLVGLYLYVEKRFRAAKSREYTWSLDAEDENGRAYVCPRIGAP